MLVVITERLSHILHWIKNIVENHADPEMMDLSCSPTPAGTSEIPGQVGTWQFDKTTLHNYVNYVSRLFHGRSEVTQQSDRAVTNDSGHSRQIDTEVEDTPRSEDDLISPDSLLSAVIERTGKVRIIHFSRHGESEYNILGRIGGNASLSPRGRVYATKLAQYVNSKLLKPGFRVWTSCLKRTAQTAKGIKAPQERIAALNELDPGHCDGLTYEEVAERFPEEFAARDDDKYYYRYPGGESYADLLERVQPVLLRLQHEGDNLLIISHQAVLRCVLGALLNKDSEELPYIQVPLHTLMRLKVSPAGACTLDMVPLSVECVDTHRAKPQNCSTARSAQEALSTVPDHY